MMGGIGFTAQTWPSTPAPWGDGPPRPPAVTAAEETPDWWPYTAQFPGWHVWEAGLAGLVYASHWQGTGSPTVVRATSPDELAHRITIRELGQQPCW